MSPEAKAIFFAVAIVLLLLDALWQRVVGRVRVLPLALAVFVFPFFWDAWDAA